jgi:putative NADPH-quinone reductase
MAKSKKILIIDGHPDPKSHCAQIAEEYEKGAQKGKFDIKKIDVRDLKFDPILHYRKASAQNLEKDLKDSQKMIKWADHIVVIFPIWWGHMPSLLKGFIDRAFTNGTVFELKKGKRIPTPLMNGKSIRVIYTQGAPRFYTRFVLRDSVWKSIKTNIFEFCGFSPVARTYIHDMHSRNEEAVGKFLRKIFDLGLNGQ